jgi:catechol 2,3-dioxygenase-like lactoylglutathione lyase family enzyme
MIHHVDFAVTDFARSRAFYVRALAPLGLAAIIDINREEGRKLTGFGSPPDPEFWIRTGQPIIGHVHVAFAAESHAAVDAFHKAAIEAGGQDRGAPGFRPRYGDHYYAAYVLDPDGHNIEAVCRTDERLSSSPKQGVRP